jgi:hypothetical protein
VNIQAKLDMRHWTDGGTGVTNFPPEREPIYIKAIEKFGDEGLILVSTGIPAKGSTYLQPYFCSLHDTKGNRDLSDFWDVFDEVKKNTPSRSDG